MGTLLRDPPPGVWGQRGQFWLLSHSVVCCRLCSQTDRQTDRLITEKLIVLFRIGTYFWECLLGTFLPDFFTLYDSFILFIVLYLL